MCIRDSQQGVPDNEGEDSPIESKMTEETSNVRARGQESQPQEEVTLHSLMDFMKEIRGERNDHFRAINEKLDKRLDKQNEKSDKLGESYKLLFEKMDNYTTAVTQQMTYSESRFFKVNEFFMYESIF